MTANSEKGDFLATLKANFIFPVIGGITLATLLKFGDWIIEVDRSFRSLENKFVVVELAVNRNTQRIDEIREQSLRGNNPW